MKLFQCDDVLPGLGHQCSHLSLEPFHILALIGLGMMQHELSHSMALSHHYSLENCPEIPQVRSLQFCHNASIQQHQAQWAQGRRYGSHQCVTDIHLLLLHLQAWGHSISTLDQDVSRV